MSITATPNPTVPAPQRSALPPLRPDEAEPIPGSITFGEFLAGLNPLHHLPVVGMIYRAATGETIPPAMRVLGGALLGGPIGMISGAVMAAIEEFRAAPASAPTLLTRTEDPPHAAG